MTEFLPNAPRPIAATIAVVIRDAQGLLVRRANPPDAGLWGFPGGKIDRGETIDAAAVRGLYGDDALEARWSASTVHGKVSTRIRCADYL